jgi:hypothetical protein
MKTTLTDKPTPAHICFSTIRHILPLINTALNICYVILAAKKTQQLNMVKWYLNIAILFSGFFLLSAGTPVNAQQYQEYDESDYDGTYEYDDGSNYNNYEETYKSYFRSAEGSRRYRANAKEEELYNGGYRKYMKEDQSWKPESWSRSNIGAREKRSGNAESVPDVSQPGKPRNNGWYGAGSDGINHNRYPEMFNADGTVSGNDDTGKGNADGGDNQEFGPPPPPDEPDVPVDTAIPLLIMGGIIIASTRLYIRKSGSY